jgi:predicted RNase H-like HicB family nuclease
MKYTIIVEETKTGFCGYVPDLPVVVAAASSREELKQLMSEAIPMHIELMREHGDEIPPRTTSSMEIEIAA